ncbi:MAG: baseplate J/gp47 family protein [Polyangiaceae bacterium]|nr:baseplate J/gp47 family protein [Polyangiaceae bacterium]
MPQLSLASLLIEETKDAIYRTALSIASGIGVPVSSWQAGDPTRSLFHVESESLSTLEVLVSNFIRSGFLGFATGVWLKIRAKQGYNVDVPEATFATTNVVLTNTGKGVHDFDPGDLTLKNSLTGKTYRNVTGGHLDALTNAGPGTLIVSVVADEAGSDSSAGAGEIDDFVAGPIGVSCSNPTAAIGLDEQDEATTVQQCLDSLGPLSPDGPREAYAFVARTPKLTGTRAVTRARVYPDSDTGDVLMYIAGPSAVSEADRKLVEEAIVRWCTPLTITPTVLIAPNVVIPVSYEIWIYKSVNLDEDKIKSAVVTKLMELFRSRPMGGDITPPDTTGVLYRTAIKSKIESAFSQIYRVELSAPIANVTLGDGEVLALGPVIGVVHLVQDP